MKFLVVDDDEIFRTNLVRSINRRGHAAAGSDGVVSALETLKVGNFTHALIDLKMPGQSGLQFIDESKQIQPALQIVVLTGFGSIPTAVEAIKLGAFNYLTKPADLDAILQAFEAPSTHAITPATEVPSLWQVEWDYLQRVLAECGGNVSHAAKRLGMHRRSLQRKLSKYSPH